MSDTVLWNEILKAARRWSIKLSQKKIVLAFSGGLDSTVLLHCLASHQKEFQLGLMAVHVNHHIRPGSGEDETFCRDFCLKQGVAFESLALDPQNKKSRESLEMWGRRERYGYFHKVLEKHGADYLFTAHHLDDQLETLLIRFQRGGSIRGLRGIFPLGNKLFRPLLCVPKQRLKEYAHNQGLEWKEDKSNLNVNIPRNWVRQVYIPLLGKSKGSWENSAANISGLMWTLVQKLESNWERQLTWISESKVQIPRSFLLEGEVHQLGMEEEFWHFIAENMNFSISRGRVSEITRQLRTKSDFKISLNSNHWLEFKGDLLTVENGKLASWETNSKYEELSVSIAEKSSNFIGFWMGREISLKANKYVKPSNFSPPRIKNQKVFLDGGCFSSTLIIRNRKKGDRFIPLGQSNSPQKLKDFFIKRKVSRRQREIQLIVCSGNKIVWLPNLEISNEFKVTESTKQILELEISWQ